MMHNGLDIKINYETHSSETFKPTHFLRHICDCINFSPVNESPNPSGKNINEHKIIILRNLM
jgi:hypothetical protein